MRYTIKKLLFLSLILTSSLQTFSQTSQQTTESLKRLVYPYPKKISIQNNYYALASKPEIKRWIDEKFKKNEFDTLKSTRKSKFKFFARKKSSLNRKYSSDLLSYLRKNPVVFIGNVEINTTFDIIPPLDALPDGDYVQYFDTVLLVNEQKKIKACSNRIAASFSLKNNLLHGEVVIFNFFGDTLKHGFYENGLKTGFWKFTNFNYSSELYKNQKQFFKKHKHLSNIQEVSTYVYKLGVRQGAYLKTKLYLTFKDIDTIELGEYENNLKAGNWQIYSAGRLKQKHTYTSDTTVFHRPLIRKNISVPYNYNSTWKFSSTDYYFQTPKYDYKEFVEIAFPIEKATILEEEKALSYELEKSNYTSSVNFDKFLDSLGYRYTFKKYERFYLNGQKMFAFNKDVNQNINIDTVFWYNGKPFDVVVYDTNTMKYIHSTYDLEGKLYKSIQYAKDGKFEKFILDANPEKTIILDGLTYQKEERNKRYAYLISDTVDIMQHKDSVIISCFKDTLAYDNILNKVFYPRDRTLKVTENAASGRIRFSKEIQFNEDMRSYTGTMVFQNGPLKTVTIFSGTTQEEIKDTLWYLNEVSNLEHANQVNDFYYEDQKYTGEIYLNLGVKKFKIEKTKKGLIINLPIFKSNYASFKKSINAYYQFKNGKKVRNKAYIDMHSANNFDANISIRDFSQMFDILYQNEIYFHDKINKQIYSKMINGKLEGLTITRNLKRGINAEISFKNGELDGICKQYAYVNAFDFELDSMPRKDVYYLNKEKHYKNNLFHGPYKEYYWHGGIKESSNFLNGQLEGEYYKKNKYLYSKSNFKNGLIDGYYQTYITLQNKAPFLLFDLNFQDGRLNGESKTYHVSGSLAKKGFFLDGKPIEDYEAYDTLGFKFQYVKFKYGYPVLEKIYEENKLSIEYEYDWRDSAYFNIEDFTQTQSLDRLASALGLDQERYSKKYYGRPSLIVKKKLSYDLTKYYGNDTIARTGTIVDGKKSFCWKYYNYFGEFLYEIEYFDTIIQLNDSVSFSVKGKMTDYDSLGKKLSESYLIEKIEKFDCSHTDHYEIRQFWTIWEANDSLHRMNGYTKNYYDNGVLQSEGMMRDGLPIGVWKFYDTYGKLNQVGNYVQGKRDGRWLSGDLGKSKFMGDICLNPNLPNVEEILKEKESQLDIKVVIYKFGQFISEQSYFIDLKKL